MITPLKGTTSILLILRWSIILLVCQVTYAQSHKNTVLNPGYNIQILDPTVKKGDFDTVRGLSFDSFQDRSPPVFLDASFEKSVLSELNISLPDSWDRFETDALFIRAFNGILVLSGDQYSLFTKKQLTNLENLVRKKARSLGQMDHY